MSHYVYHPESDRFSLSGMVPTLSFVQKGQVETEAQERKALMADLAIVAFLFFFFGTFLLLVTKFQGSGGPPEWSLAIYVVTMLVAVAIAVATPLSSVRVALIGGPMTLLVLWACASYKWSYLPATTIIQSLMLIATYITSCMVAMHLSWARIGRIFSIALSIEAALSAAIALLKPDLGIMTEIPGAWCGLWFHKQALGISMAFSAGCVAGYLAYRPKEWTWCVPCLLIILVCLVKSQATTALVMSALAISAPFAVKIMTRHPSIAAFGAWSIFTAACVAFISVKYIAPIFLDLVNKSPTLTGRTLIWANLDGYFSARPWTGYGFQAFWEDKSVAAPVQTLLHRLGGWEAPNAHSTPFELRLQLGLIGLGLGFLIILRTWLLVLWQAMRVPGVLVAIGTLTAFSGILSTESIAFDSFSITTVFIYSLFVKVPLSLWNKEGAVQAALYR
ncbi:MAG: hypothetical protein RL186_314 [Pseudomonadota bacterium]